MTILYDFEVTNPGEFIFKPNGNLLVNDMRDFVYSRLKILEDEINQYPEGFIIIHVFGTLAGELGISYTGFTETLRDKMSTCVSNDDIGYLMSRWDNLFPKK